MLKYRWLCWLSVMALWIGCGDNTTPEPFGLPPTEAMSLDLSLFGGVLVAPSIAEGASHFAVAAGYVSEANLAIGIPIATPLQLLKNARDTAAIISESGSQIWEYSLDLSGTTYQIRLEGILDNTNIQWQLYVSNAALDLEDFLWIEGQSALDNKGGRWYFKSHQESKTLVLAEWTVSESREFEAIFTRQDRDSDSYGSMLTYRRSPGPQGDILSLFLQDAMGRSAEISWNSLSSAGYIRSADYNNGDKSCWGMHRQDVTCE